MNKKSSSDTAKSGMEFTSHQEKNYLQGFSEPVKPKLLERVCQAWEKIFE